MLNYVLGDKDIVVDPNLCAECVASENKPECMICIHREQEMDKLDRSFACFEHYHRGNMRRIFPVKQHYAYELLSKLSKRNQIMILWFMEKCKDNPVWC